MKHPAIRPGRCADAEVGHWTLGIKTSDPAAQSRRRVRFVGVGGKVYGGEPDGLGEFGVAEGMGAAGVD